MLGTSVKMKEVKVSKAETFRNLTDLLGTSLETKEVRAGSSKMEDLAVLFPEPKQGQRTDLLGTSPITGEVKRTDLSNARLIVKQAPDLVPAVK